MSGYLEDYHILQTSKEEPLIRAIRNGMEGADVPVETSKGEWGRGQEEINLRYAEALEMADRTALYKHGAKEIAHLHGTAITFMAKYDMTAAGSSFHLHSSLWDKVGRKPLFAAAGHGAKTTSTPLFGQWLAGQMAMAREFSCFYAPGVNSYKRYQSGSFAPTRIVAGWDNRTCGFRLCGEGGGFRVENRIPGADANPYLAFAAMMMAGLDGVLNKIEPGEPLDKDIYDLSPEEMKNVPSMPASLEEALDCLEDDHAFLLRGDVFTEELIETFISYKRKAEADAVRLRPHPYEFALYYDI